MAGEIVICQKSKPYLPNFSRELVAHRGGGGGGSSNKPPLVEQWLLQNT